MMWREPRFMDIINIANDLREDELDQCRAFGIMDVKSIIDRSLDISGRRFTYVDETTNVPPLVTGGFAPTGVEGVYRSWFLASEYAWKNYGREITALTVKNIDFMFDNGMERVETVCLASRKMAHRWYKAVGLHQEPTQMRAPDGRELSLFVKERGSV